MKRSRQKFIISDFSCVLKVASKSSYLNLDSFSFFLLLFQTVRFLFKLPMLFTCVLVDYSGSQFTEPIGRKVISILSLDNNIYITASAYLFTIHPVPGEEVFFFLSKVILPFLSISILPSVLSLYPHSSPLLFHKNGSMRVKVPLV